ncbi:MAG: four helix bundle protein [Candidatus Pacebacteria bacterium]|nr:four helix bundle protein [Candidatus Paceibacterota bacterium]
MIKRDFSKSEDFKRRLYQFVLRLIRFVDKLPENRTTRILGDQLVRSGTSILANYIEGKAASSRKDYTNFFNHSLKSANESKVWLAILKDLNYDKTMETEWLLNELTEISRIFASSILTLKGKRNSA